MTTSHPHRTLPVMIGTAGHVDHGKTSLVKHLTGISTDTLKEEKERGMSIDFGVAPFVLDNQQVVGIIDVPGHQHFIRNMVAGASSIDILMLVVAADDSVMPQTMEHLRIAKMLRMSRLFVVITKVDLVDQGLIALVQEEVHDFLAGLGFSGVPQIPVSNVTGQGLAEVRRQINVQVMNLACSSEEQPFRMFVRKAFTQKGYGTVVTGVPQSGRISVDAPLLLLPGGKKCTIRALQNYRAEVTEAQAHVSTAINLRDLEPEELQRGMALVEPGTYREVRQCLARFTNETKKEVLSKQSDLRLHLGTAAVVVRATEVGRQGIGPQQSGFVLLKLRTPLAVGVGDRFILRSLSPAETWGGGVILSTEEIPGEVPETQRATTDDSLLPHASEAVAAEDYLLAQCYAGVRPFITWEQAKYAAQLSEEHLVAKLKNAVQERHLVAVSENLWLVRSRVREVTDYLAGILRAYHGANKLALGLKPSYVCELLKIPGGGFKAMLPELLSDERLAYENEHLSLKGQAPKVSPRELVVREAIIRAVKAAGIQTVAKGNLQAEQNISETEWKKIMRLLIEEKQVVPLGSNVIAREIIDTLEEKIILFFLQRSSLELNQFRELSGMSRNVAVAVLEYFDAQGLTARQGNGRVLKRKG